MNKHLVNLAKSVVFKDIKPSNISNILKDINYNIKDYNKDDIIAMQGEDCSKLGIILNGEVEIHKTFPSGKVVTINYLPAGNVFGEAIVFSNRHLYPATIISTTNSKIMYLEKEVIINLMSTDKQIISNFMGLLSNRILMLNDRITNLHLDTLRKKISNIILIEYEKQNSLNLILPYNRKKMAELLNIPRPSLSRELINMKDDKLIDFNRNNIKILDLQGIEDSLL